VMPVQRLPDPSKRGSLVGVKRNVADPAPVWFISK